MHTVVLKETSVSKQKYVLVWNTGIMPLDDNVTHLDLETCQIDKKTVVLFF